jgi:hypothetical protein
MSAVKHLDTGYWTLPEVLTMLEGGNGNFLLAVQGNKQMRRPNSLERRTASRLGKAGKLGNSAGGLAKGNLFAVKYKNKQASSYCAMLQQRVQAVCGAFQCNRALPFDVAQQDLQVDQFLERPEPAKVRLRDPPTRKEILQVSKSRGGSTIGDSSRYRGASSRDLSSARSKVSSGMRSRINSNMGNEGRRTPQPSQIHTIYEEDGQSEVASQPPRRASNGSKQESIDSTTTGRSSKALSASSNDKKSSKKSGADTPSSPVQGDAPRPHLRRDSAGASAASAGPCPPTKLVRRASDPARVPNYLYDKKNKLRKQTKRQKKQERRRRASLP